MNLRLSRVIPVLFVLSCAASCMAPIGMEGEPAAPQSGQASVAAAAPPAPAGTEAPPAPLALPPPATPQPAPTTIDGIPEVRLGAQAPVLTETLDKTLNMLTDARLENEKLKEQLAAAQKALSASQAELEEMTTQLTQAGTRVQEFEQEMEKWKQDVLGFRDEIRAYEEAEIEVLREVVVLLRGFKKDAAQVEGGKAP